MKQTFTLIICIFLSTCLFSQKVGWVKKQGGNNSDQTNGVAIDKDGNIVTVGTFDATATFGG
jgi:hypothetical protein